MREELATLRKAYTLFSHTVSFEKNVEHFRVIEKKEGALFDVLDQAKHLSEALDVHYGNGCSGCVVSRLSRLRL